MASLFVKWLISTGADPGFDQGCCSSLGRNTGGAIFSWGPGSGCKTHTLGSFSNALLITSISYKSENQVVHEQKFKDPLNGTCQFSSVG